MTVGLEPTVSLRFARSVKFAIGVLLRCRSHDLLLTTLPPRFIRHRRRFGSAPNRCERCALTNQAYFCTSTTAEPFPSDWLNRWRLKIHMAQSFSSDWQNRWLPALGNSQFLLRNEVARREVYPPGRDLGIRPLQTSALQSTHRIQPE